MAEPVDPDELIDANEVAEILGLGSRNAVSVYRARYDDFPAPVIDRPPCVLWHRPTVTAWRRDRHRP